MQTQTIAGTTPTPEKRYTILIVDDSPHCREPLARILRLNGYQTISAQDGLEALDALKHEPPPDLILLDLMMPRMDGMAFLNRLQNLQQFRHVPVVILSAMSDEGDQRRARQLGARAFLVKASFSVPELMKMIEDNLHRGHH